MFRFKIHLNCLNTQKNEVLHLKRLLRIHSSLVHLFESYDLRIFICILSFKVYFIFL